MSCPSSILLFLCKLEFLLFELDIFQEIIFYLTQILIKQSRRNQWNGHSGNCFALIAILGNYIVFRDKSQINVANFRSDWKLDWKHHNHSEMPCLRQSDGSFLPGEGLEDWLEDNSLCQVPLSNNVSKNIAKGTTNPGVDCFDQ